MASSQATRARSSSIGTQRPSFKANLTQSSLSAGSKIPTFPPELPQIRTKTPQSPPTTTSPEHSPSSSFSLSPSTLSSITSPFSPIPRGAAHLATRSQERVRGQTVFRPPGVAGKGSHRRAEQPPRPQPQPPVFREFHLQSEARGAKSRAKFEELRKEEEEKRKEDSRFRARSVPGTLYRGPPVVLDRTSTLRRASHGRRQ